MKIGIFGDSFADPTQMNPTPTWSSILSEKHEVDNYAIMGSNLYYSASLILKTFQRYNKVILVVTQPGRLMIPEYYTVPEQRKRFIAGIGTIPDLESDIKPNESYLNKFYQAARQYLTLLQDLNYEKYIHSLMLKDLSSKISNLILIPAFKDSGAPESINSMFDIYLKECKAWGETMQSARLYKDIRNCHMTAENNAIFADKVEEWINGAPVYINVDDFVAPANKEFYLK